MPIPPSFYVPAGQNLPEAPSTRSSVHLWTTYYPVDVTLAAAGTAQNLWTPDTTIPTVNLVTNPSFETSDPPAGFTASGATLATGANPRTGSDSISVTPNNAAAGEGFYWTSPSIGGDSYYLIASMYFRRAAGSGSNAKLVIADSSGTTLVTGNVVTLSTTYTRSIVKYQLPAQATTYRVYAVTDTQHATVFLGDDLQVEVRQDGAETDFVNAVTPALNTYWYGTANASESYRSRGLRSVRGWDLNVSLATYFALDNGTASSTNGIYITAAKDWSPQWAVDVRTAISILNVTAAQTPVIRGVLWGIP